MHHKLRAPGLREIAVSLPPRTPSRLRYIIWGPFLLDEELVTIEVFQSVEDSESFTICYCGSLRRRKDGGGLHTAFQPCSFRALKLDSTYKQFTDTWV